MQTLSLLSWCSTIRQSLCVCVAAYPLLSFPTLNADEVILTLDLRNAFHDDAMGGGTWQLFARKVENDKAPQGDAGIVFIRALIDNINLDSVKFAADINQRINGGPFVNALSNGTVEIVYQQDTDATVTQGIGVDENPNRDRLIASGTWPAGPRPKFGKDDTAPKPFRSSAKFFEPSRAATGNAAIPTRTRTSVITLGDLNESGTISNSDIAPFSARLPNAAPALPYHPAADIDQSGTVTLEDRELLISILSGP